MKEAITVSTVIAALRRHGEIIRLEALLLEVQLELLLEYYMLEVTNFANSEIKTSNGANQHESIQKVMDENIYVYILVVTVNVRASR